MQFSGAEKSGFFAAAQAKLRDFRQTRDMVGKPYERSD
jgi:hypothetical protein